MQETMTPDDHRLCLSSVSVPAPDTKATSALTQAGAILRMLSERPQTT